MKPEDYYILKAVERAQVDQEVKELFSTLLIQVEGKISLADATKIRRKIFLAMLHDRKNHAISQIYSTILAVGKNELRRREACEAVNGR